MLFYNENVQELSWKNVQKNLCQNKEIYINTKYLAYPFPCVSLFANASDDTIQFTSIAVHKMANKTINWWKIINTICVGTRRMIILSLKML